MLATPMGRLIVSVDDRALDYSAEWIQPQVYCLDVDGRYLIEVHLPADQKEHRISCRIEDYALTGTEESISEEKLQSINFYQGQTKLTLGMQANTAYLTGQEDPVRDYDREFLPDGLQYLTFPFTRTTQFFFGVAWIKRCTEENALQTQISADPGTMCLQKSDPRWIVKQMHRNKDKLLELTVEYRCCVQSGSDYWESWSEEFILSRPYSSMEYHLQLQGREMSAQYQDIPQVRELFHKMEEVHFPTPQKNTPTDVMHNSKSQSCYRITAFYASEGRRVMCGRLDGYGIPEHFEDFVECIHQIIAWPCVSDVLDRRIYSRIPRRRSDLMFCDVLFAERCDSRTFSYLCPDKNICQGSWVLAPFGKGNRIRAGYVYDIQYAQPENAPYPVHRTKKIIRECTQDDLVQLEQQEKEDNPIAYRCPDAHYAVSFRMCPMLKRRIYWGGRDGCCDVGHAILQEEFMAHFEPPFDPQQAEKICAECGWRSDEE